jgi:hypothetical protein
MTRPDRDIDLQTFTRRFIDRCVQQCGFTHFDDGESVEAYCREVADSYWADPDRRAEGPETCADEDMTYWGED